MKLSAWCTAGLQNYGIRDYLRKEGRNESSGSASIRRKLSERDGRVDDGLEGL